MRLILYLNMAIWLGIGGLATLSLKWASDIPSSDVPPAAIGIYFAGCLLTGLITWKKYG